MMDDDYEKMRRELLVKQVSEVFKKDPKNHIRHMEELGFTWVDDDEDDQEEVEEQQSKPENQNQELLVAYFHGEIGLADSLLELFKSEKESDNPNYPLFRKYFKRGNQNFKKPLLLGLADNQTDIGLLNDLSFFHWENGILGELIQCYLKACDLEQEENRFKELAKDFYYNTVDDNYDALYELKQLYQPDSPKGKITQQICRDIESEPEKIEF